MSRGALALALLLAIAPLLAVPGSAQLPGGVVIPTLQEVHVGDLNVTMWIMRDASSAAFSQPDPANPLGALFNLNFSAGSAGIFYIKANRTQDGIYQMRAHVSAEPATLALSEPNASIPLGVRPCLPVGNTITCTVNTTSPQSDYAAQFYTYVTTPPGPLRMRVDIETWKEVDGNLQFQARGNATYALSMFAAVPTFAASKSTAGVDVYAWVQGSSLGLTGTGCQAGSMVRHDLNISKGFPSLLCVFAIPRGAGTYRLATNATAPAAVSIPNPTWQSAPFNASSGGVGSPLASVYLQAVPDAPVGAGEVAVRYTLERLDNGTWASVGGDEVRTPYAITKASAVRGPSPLPGIRWELQLPILAAAVAGLGYMVHKHRPPKVQPRSQALRDLRKPKGDEGAAATQEAAQQQRAEVEQASWDKKLQILEAKREDILKSIRIAEERKDRGEITDHVLAGIKERKQRQLEQVEKEMEDLRG